MLAHQNHFQSLIKTLSWSGIMAVGIVLIPLAARLALLIFATDPNPRHPPIDLREEALGWTIVAAFFGLSVTVIIESIVMREATGFWGRYRGLIIGSGSSVAIGAFIAIVMAILTMNSVDGQGITSTRLAVLAGLLSGIIGAGGGAVIGATGKRIINYFTT